MTSQNDTAATGGDPTDDDYFTEEERAGLARWRAIVADMPPMTQDEIQRIGALFRRMDQRRNRNAT